MKYRACQLLVSLSFLFVGCELAEANLIITPTFDSSITSDSNAATIESTIDTAISNIEGDIANNTTVTITFGEMDSGLGQSSTYYSTINYNSYLSLLENNQTLSAYDKTALTSLGLTAPYTSPNPTTNPVNGTTQLTATVPLLTALGVNISLPEGATDSTIDFNNSLVDESLGTPTGGQYSLESVVQHEMDEVLGIGGAGSVLTPSTNVTTTSVGPLDLFRYSSNGVRSFSTTAGADPYFSIDGGKTNLVYFNQTGTGDYADWGNGTTGAQSGNIPPQVQDAFGTPNSNPQLGSNEMTALDVVGWNLTTQGMALEGVPEPGCIYLVFGGLIVLGIHHRFRRTTQE